MALPLLCPPFCWPGITMEGAGTEDPALSLAMVIFHLAPAARSATSGVACTLTPWPCPTAVLAAIGFKPRFSAMAACRAAAPTAWWACSRFVLSCAVDVCCACVLYLAAPPPSFCRRAGEVAGTRRTAFNPGARFCPPPTGCRCCGIGFLPCGRTAIGMTFLVGRAPWWDRGPGFDPGFGFGLLPDLGPAGTACFFACWELMSSSRLSPNFFSVTISASMVASTSRPEGMRTGRPESRSRRTLLV
mmetsp:Transcript_11119/g.28514  ORF Transcript_11119/g.28514 Transcript_11119/m.28514 type:complete len:245 (-) Transcript_11119:58-792(-)